MPQEPILVEVAPISDDWLHEIKYDGFRTQLVLDWAGGRAGGRRHDDALGSCPCFDGITKNGRFRLSGRS